MQISTEHLNSLKQWEGLRLKSYQDQGGIWTIGYGHTENVKEGQSITQEEADSLLKKDLEKFEAIVTETILVELTQAQFAALVSFVFNVGEEAFKKSSLVKKLNQGNYESVPGELSRWVYCSGVRNLGLVNRRAAESGLWAKGSFVAGNQIEAERPTAPVFHKTPEGQATMVTTAGVLGSIFTDSANQLYPYTSSFSLLKPIFLILTLLGLALGMWSAYRKINR